MLVSSFHLYCLLSYLPFFFLSPLRPFPSTLLPIIYFSPPTLSLSFPFPISSPSQPYSSSYLHCFLPHFSLFSSPIPFYIFSLSTCTFFLSPSLHPLSYLLSPTGLLRDQFSFAPVSCGGLAVLQVLRLSVATSSGNKKYGPLGFAGTIAPPYGPDIHQGRDNGPRRPPGGRETGGDTDAVGP